MSHRILSIAAALAAAALTAVGMAGPAMATPDSADVAAWPSGATLYLTPMSDGRPAVWRFGCVARYSIDDRTAQEYGADLQAGLQRLTDASNIAFVQVPPGTPGVNISVTTHDHPDSNVEGLGGYPIPSGPGAGTGGIVELYSAEDVSNPDYSFADRGIALVMHEFGHVLGLGHNPHKDSVMYPSMTREGVGIDFSQMDEYLHDGYIVGGTNADGRLFAERQMAPFNTTWSTEDRQALGYVRDLNGCTSPGASAHPGGAAASDGPGTSAPTPACAAAQRALARAMEAHRPGRIAAAREEVARLCATR